jgi:hypothetical protein
MYFIKTYKQITVYQNKIPFPAKLLNEKDGTVLIAGIPYKAKWDGKKQIWKIS